MWLVTMVIEPISLSNVATLIMLQRLRIQCNSACSCQLIGTTFKIHNQIKKTSIALQTSKVDRTASILFGQTKLNFVRG